MPFIPDFYSVPLAVISCLVYLLSLSTISANKWEKRIGNFLFFVGISFSTCIYSLSITVKDKRVFIMSAICLVVIGVGALFIKSLASGRELRSDKFNGKEYLVRKINEIKPLCDMGEVAFLKEFEELLSGEKIGEIDFATFSDYCEKFCFLLKNRSKTDI